MLKSVRKGRIRSLGQPEKARSFALPPGIGCRSVRSLSESVSGSESGSESIPVRYDSWPSAPPVPLPNFSSTATADCGTRFLVSESHPLPSIPRPDRTPTPDLPSPSTFSDSPSPLTSAPPRLCGGSPDPNGEAPAEIAEGAEAGDYWKGGMQLDKLEPFSATALVCRKRISQNPSPQTKDQGLDATHHHGQVENATALLCGRLSDGKAWTGKAAAFFGRPHAGRCANRGVQSPLRSSFGS